MNHAAQRARQTVCDAVVAEQVGMSLHDLHLIHPADFGAPRDFRWDGRHYLYTEAGLQALRRELERAGQVLAAELMARLIAQQFPAPSVAEEIGLQRCA